jgi:hypothetical protein
MDFDLSEEQRAFRDAVSGFASRHLAEGALARARAPGFPWDVAKLMADQGLLGITISEADGGQGGALMDAVLAIEAVAGVCPRSADVVQAGNFAAIRTFAEYAGAEQKARYLPDLLAGKALIAVAMSEPEAGSAATELRTTATPDGDGHRITGSKVFTTHGSDATLFLVYVRFGPGVGGIGSVLVERDADGFTLGEPVRYMSGEVWRQLYFEDVRVGPENVLLGPGGFKKQISAFNVERIGNAARALAPSAGSPSTSPATTRSIASSSASRSPSSRACSGSSPTPRSSSKPRGSCSTAPRSTPTTACPRARRPRSPRSPATRPGSSPPTRRCRCWAAPASAR